ncbi:type 1 glutamine amidotransferase domain-containing protein [Tabrizicola sp.]|uniref:type 1 glutamine amidotransferase domain-containing protein n=1 Tax=Tabrizicola sp. TaxID=2005166 RepID=UPI003F320209
MARIAIILTSHTKLGDTGRATGFHFEELATPYFALLDAGHDVTIASIKGGPAAHDPGSFRGDAAERPASVNRFAADPGAMAKLAATVALEDLKAEDFDAVFLPGGHGTMWDFPGNPVLARLLGTLHAKGGVVAAVCHGPAGLVDVRRPDGTPLVKGLRVNSFTNAEEDAISLSTTMPFMLESRLRDLGGRFEAGEKWTSKAVSDDRVVTGQNPMSAKAVADLMLAALATAPLVSAD